MFFLRRELIFPLLSSITLNSRITGWFWRVSGVNPLTRVKNQNITFFFLIFLLNSSASIIMDCCISCARNSPTLDKRLYILCLVFYSLLYNLDTSLISYRRRKSNIEIEIDDGNLFLHAILISLLLLPHLLH